MHAQGTFIDLCRENDIDCRMEWKTFKQITTLLPASKLWYSKLLCSREDKTVNRYFTATLIECAQAKRERVTLSKRLKCFLQRCTRVTSVAGDAY